MMVATVLGLASVAHAQEALSPLLSVEGVASAVVQSDSMVIVSWKNGATTVLPVSSVVITVTGEILISEEQETLLLASSQSNPLGVLAAGGFAAALVVGSTSGGGSEPEGQNAVIGGTQTGAVTEDAAAVLSTTGVLSVTDADAGEAVFAAQSGTVGAGGYGSFDLGTDGTWRYTADSSQTAIQSLGAGETLTDSFTAVTADGTAQRVTVTITGVNDVTVVGGQTSGSVTEDDAVTLSTTGTLTVSDVDAGEGSYVEQPATAELYGTFTLGTDGVWNYTVDNAQAAIRSLNTGDTLTATFTATTDTGVTQAVTITINGTFDVVIELSKVLADADTRGFVINGVSSFDRSGYSVSSAGDVNGDGFDDLIVGAVFDDPNGNSFSGASFVVFGKTDGTAVELSDVEGGTGGFVINGVAAYDLSGISVNAAGDVNGDGLDDLIVRAACADSNGNQSGVSFVVFGKADGAVVQLSDVQGGTGGFVINGVTTGDRSGFSVSGAGDVNGDGLDDLIVGADGDDPNGSGSGASFVVFGGDFSGAATQVGTTAADMLSGTAADDVIFAGTGNDTIDGGGGTDRLSGGSGADRFVVRGLAGTTTVIDFVQSEGDTLDVSAFGIADFTTFQGLLSQDGPGGHDLRLDLDADTVVIFDDLDTTALTATNVIL